MGKDYYKILEVDKNATAEELKKAFRKKAHKYHPDKEGGDEAKFKEANEAYQVLGNEEKRKKYDQFGSSFDQQGGFGGGMDWGDFMNQARSGGGGFSGGFGGIDLGDIFGDIFGGGGRKSRGPQKGNDIQVNLIISLKDAAFGMKKEIELYKHVKCDRCDGSLAEPGSKVETCSTCNGQGQVSKVQRTFIGNIQTSAVCHDCSGIGKKIEKKCSKCSGEGVVKEKEVIEIGVPAGIDSGSTIRFSGKGEAGQFGTAYGDLYVQVRIDEGKKFERHGDDILTKKKISFIQATLGDKVDVETLDGDVTLKIPSGTQPGTRLRMKDKGMTRFQRSDRGDMYVEVEVEIPKKLSRKQKKLLEEYSQAE